MTKLTLEKKRLIDLLKVTEQIDSMLYFAVSKDGSIYLKSTARKVVFYFAKIEGMFNVSKWDTNEDEIHIYILNATELRKKITLLSKDIGLDIQTEDEYGLKCVFFDVNMKITTRCLDISMLGEEDDIRYNPSEKTIANLTKNYKSNILVNVESLKKIKTILTSINEEQFTLSCVDKTLTFKTSEIEYIIDGELNTTGDIEVQLKNSIFNKLNIDSDTTININENAVMFQNEAGILIGATELR